MTIEEFREICDKEGIGAVAKTIGYSKSAVDHVKNGTYKGNPAKILEAADVYSTAAVDCPIFRSVRPISRSECISMRDAAARSTNPLRSIATRTCPKCENGGR